VGTAESDDFPTSDKAFQAIRRGTNGFVTKFSTAGTASSPPTVTGVQPRNGSPAGGTSVTITGSALSGATKVLFGDAAATDVRVDEAGTEIVATAPAHDPAFVDVTVTTPRGPSVTSLSSEFAYADGAWGATGSLLAGRYPFNGNGFRERGEGHTATVLSNGKVLVAGGCAGTAGGCEPSGEAELFDPAQGTWTRTGNLTQARTGHTATLLKDGRVLVVGGLESPGGRLSSAEVYDPVSGSWNRTKGDLTTGRVGHTATLLQDGSVLVAGSRDPKLDAAPSAAAEVYDPAAGTWKSVGDMGLARSAHTATLLSSGKVLVAGGLRADDAEHPKKYDASTNATDSAELYDPGPKQWSPTGALQEVRDLHTATRLPDG
jgi:hypothetical protein